MERPVLYVVEILAGFLVALVTGRMFIPWTRRLKIGQHIREDGPRTHLTKEGTPTMGGVIFLAGTIVPAVTGTLLGLLRSQAWLAIFSFFSFGLIGFIDDWRKFRRGRSLGLRAREKMGLEVLAAVLFLYLWFESGGSSHVIIPAVNKSLELGAIYPLFGVFLMVSSSNAMNLTDGLDGLAAGVSVAGLAALSFVCFQRATVADTGGLQHLVPVAMGAVLGFLVYNHYPAKVIMGDTGSLALGALLSALAILTKTEILLLFFAAVPVVETLSVIAQVISFQLFGRRIFKMSPIHHHFELSGWRETTVVRVFWCVQVILACIGIWVMSLV